MRLDDDGMSRRHLTLRRAAAGWEVQDLVSKNGTLLNGRQCETATSLVDGDVIEVGSSVLIFRESGTFSRSRIHPPTCSNRDLATTRGPAELSSLLTLEMILEQRFEDLMKVAPSSVPVLLRGATGTGKELIARAVHKLSGRLGNFVPINCGAMPQSLTESEFFGYRKGAFSGAYEDRGGLVRQAHGGTLFLDEVAELPLESQAALLRVLQDGESRQIGALEPVRVDIRVIAATHQDVEKRIAAGLFRQDLYARLSGFELGLPALSRRREDIGTLIASILSMSPTPARDLTIQRQAGRALFTHGYPSNIRELEQAIRAAVILSDGHQIRVEHLPEAMQAGPQSAIRQPHEMGLRERLEEVLLENGGNVTAAARAMNKGPTQIRRWCDRFGIDHRKFRGRGRDS